MSARRYVLAFGASCEHVPEHPERTARRTFGWDVMLQVWPNRASMARTIRMQERGEDYAKAWRAVVALSPGEGY